MKQRRRNKGRQERRKCENLLRFTTFAVILKIALLQIFCLGHTHKTDSKKKKSVLLLCIIFPIAHSAPPPVVPSINPIIFLVTLVHSLKRVGTISVHAGLPLTALFLVNCWRWIREYSIEFGFWNAHFVEVCNWVAVAMHAALNDSPI